MAISLAEAGAAGAEKENFAALLEESLQATRSFEGTVVKGRVIAVENDMALIDVGLKAEGRVPLKEFATPGRPAEIVTGDEVEIYVERLEDKNGEAVLSRDKAKREEAWSHLETAFKDSDKVSGVIFGKVKGGFTVDLSGAVAFLPGSQVDIRPVRDIGPLMGAPQPFLILKMDRSRGNIVVSRRAVLEESRAEARNELIANLREGQVLNGVVKNITDYGAFIDLGGVDGLLHVTDIAWHRINHPSESLQIGQTVEVQVIRFNLETQRISLGMKQLQVDPWEGVALKYPVGANYLGRVTNITDYGAFVELEPGVEGLVHVSEMSWTKKNVHPGKIVSTSQEVDVRILDLDLEKRRISLGIKQTHGNPWESFLEQFPLGSTVEGEVKNITEFGLFVGLPGEIDGMVHLSDLAWGRSGDEAVQDFSRGDTVQAKVLDVDVEKERISLGMKQLSEDPFESATRGGARGSGGGIRRGTVLTVTVASVLENALEVTLPGELTGIIRRSELGRERSEQRPDRFAVGERIDAKITQVDKAGRRIQLSIKALEVEEERSAMQQFGSSDSGASLGDILGAALRNRARQDDTDDTAEADDTADETDNAAENDGADENDNTDENDGADENDNTDE